MTPKNGVSDGVRTRDFQIHNLALYHLSYAHHKALKFYVLILSKHRDGKSVNEKGAIKSVRAGQC